MKSFLIITSVAALALAGCGQSEGDAKRIANDTGATNGTATGNPAEYTGTTATTPAMSAADSAQAFVAEVASSDQFEIQASQIIAQKTANADVKRFAQLMMDEHGANTNELGRAASRAALDPPGTVLLPKHQTRLDELRQSGSNSDRVYLDQQAVAHAEALALVRDMITKTTGPEPLADFGKAALPVLEEHARQVADLIKAQAAN